jgi:hypothetical protein
MGAAVEQVDALLEIEAGPDGGGAPAEGHHRNELAQHATDVFSQDVSGRLVLVTCEDWDGERFLSNVVVTATRRT